MELIVSRNSQIDIYAVKLLWNSVNHSGDPHRHFKKIWDLTDKMLDKLATYPKYVENVSDINCNLKAKFYNKEESPFSSM